MDILRKNIHTPTLAVVCGYGILRISNGLNNGTMVGMAEILGNTLGIFIGETGKNVIINTKDNNGQAGISLYSGDYEYTVIKK